VSQKGHGTDNGTLVVYTAETLENRDTGEKTLRYISGMPSLGKRGVWK